MFGAPNTLSIGRFEVGQKLGSGGMGVVYEARDPDLDRRVALKVLRADRIEPAVVRRLTVEARALAKLRHPNVVTVYEVGTDGDDRFIVMDLVEGQTLRAWLQESRSWREVVARFVDAGRGLQAAHEAGLVHRDFKPDNVLVEGESTRVVDFGLAATSDDTTVRQGPLLHTVEGEPDARITQTGCIVGTPAYMAPEQFNGWSTAASDQYAFCVALFEALHGERPFPEPDQSWPAFVRARSRPLPADVPRDVPRWLRRALARGLIADPSLRWPSMAALLDVLGRASENRWRRPAALVGFAGVGVLVGGIAMGQQDEAESCDARIAPLREAWNDARRAALRQGFQDTGLSYAAVTWGSVERDLDTFAEQWREERVHVCEMSRVAAQADTALVSDRVRCLLRSLSDFEVLLRSLEGPSNDVVDRALAASSGLPPLSACSEDALRLQQTERDAGLNDAGPAAYTQLGEARVATLLGDYETAETDIDGLLKIAADADDPVLKVRALLARARIEIKRGDLDGAEETAKLAVEESEVVGDTRLRVQAQIRLASALALGGVDPRSPDLLRSTRAALHRLGDPPETVAALLHVESIQARTEGELERALGTYRARLEVLESLPSPPVLDIASSLSKISLLLGELGRPKEALEVDLRALKVFEEKLGETAPGTVRARSGLVDRLTSLGEVDEAIAQARRAVEAADASRGRDSILAARARAALAIALAGSSNLAEAEPLFREVAERFEARFGPDNHEVASAYSNYARILMMRDKQKESRGVLENAIELAERSLPPDHPDLVFLFNNLCHTNLNLERWPDAEKAARSALRVSLAKFKNDHQRTARVRHGLGLALLWGGDVEGALVELEEAVRVLEAKKARPGVVGGVRVGLARAVRASGDRKRAYALGLQARAEYEADGAPMVEDLERLDAWMAEF